MDSSLRWNDKWKTWIFRALNDRSRNGFQPALE
jgi:hypothetical protein